MWKLKLNDGVEIILDNITEAQTMLTEERTNGKDGYIWKQ